MRPADTLRDSPPSRVVAARAKKSKKTGRALRDAAYRHHKAGRLRQAYDAYRAILRERPDDHGALHGLGLLAHQSGQPEEAVRLITRAIAIAGGVLADHPGNTAYHGDLADALRAMGDLERAESAYRVALMLDSAYLPALSGLGIALAERGAWDEAEARFRRALELVPNEARLHNNLANVLLARGAVTAAVARYRRALICDPGDARAHHNLGAALAAQGRREDAIASLKRALAIAPDYVAARFALGCALAATAAPAEARACFEAVLARQPGHVAARYMLHAFNEGPPPDTAPADYVREILGQQAARFDAHLVDHLGYRAPDLLRAALDRVADGSGRGSWSVLDLGCGTGLAGVAMRDLAGRLVGVDLSPDMIREARTRGIYDELVVADAVDALAATANAYDLVVAADLLIYVGRLDGIFRHGRGVLRAGGSFTLSTERCPGDGFTLRPTGRFAHGEGYVRARAAAHGLRVALCEDIDVRNEGGVPLLGQIFVLTTDSQG